LKRSLWGMVALLVIGAVLYTAGLDYGRPRPEYSPSTVQNAWLNGATVFHPDAFAYTGIGYRMLVRQQAVPSYYHNPSLNIYSDLILFYLSGSLALPHRVEYGDREIAPFSLYVMSQYLSALFSILDRRVGLVTAALVMLIPLSTQHAHYATPNAQTVTCASAALLLGIIVLKQGQRRVGIYLMSGFMIGLTASARYNAAVVGVIVAFAMLANCWTYRRWWRIPLAVLMVPIGFVIGTPGSVLETQSFLNDLQGILTWYKTFGGGPGFSAPDSFTAVLLYWRYTIFFVVGPLAALAGLIGIGLLVGDWRKRWQNVWIGAALVAYLIAYSYIVLFSKRLNANVLLPLILPLALLAAYTVVRLWDSFGQRSWQPWLIAGSLALLLMWPAYLSLRFAQLISLPDNRMLAQEWVYQHVPRGSTVHLFGSYNVPLDPLDYSVSQTFSFSQPSDGPTAPALAQIILYSDTGLQAAQRDPSTADDPALAAAVTHTLTPIANTWKVLARFPRQYWPGEVMSPDDVSYWHQMEIVIYCNPTSCPVQ
jgi:hypothetical protein